MAEAFGFTEYQGSKLIVLAVGLKARAKQYHAGEQKCGEKGFFVHCEIEVNGYP
jgi:hypothetical protein